MLMKGFTFPYSDKTVFVSTSRNNKTKKLARDILCEMDLPDGRADELLYWLNKATLMFKRINNEKWYSIKGRFFTEVGPEHDLMIVTIK